jgi:signal transduction histidine kinase
MEELAKKVEWLDILERHSGVGLWDAILVDDDAMHPKSRWTWSDEFRRLCGFSDEIDFPNVVQSWSDRLHPDDAGPTFIAFNAAVKRGARYEAIYRLKIKDGSYRWFHATGGAVRGTAAGLCRACGSLVDIHAAKQAEEDRQKLLLDLDTARTEAEAASRAKSDFLATVSHELRTPLNAIIGFSDLQRNEIYGPLGHPRYREYANDIHTSGQHLLDLVETILDISKAEARMLQVEPTWLDPLEILETTMPLIRGAAEAKQIRISRESPAAQLRCFADARALRQILLNLLSNAVKFTPDGGSVTVKFAPEDRAMELTVRDTGIGVAKSDLPRLMKPFEQADRGYGRQNGGTGLGLPLVDSLTRLHGGEFSIDSTIGVGTAATVRLPFPEGPGEQPA